jgi:site-specific DNA-cytosine methylase
MNVDPELRKRVEQIKSSPVQLYREAGDYSNRELVEGIVVSPDDIAAIEAVARGPTPFSRPLTTAWFSPTTTSGGSGDMEPTHASFFSGVGGLDMGLERAGWRTVSVSEIEPYASAILAERWPDVPNLGDVVAVARTDVDARRELGGSIGQERAPGGAEQVVTSASRDALVQPEQRPPGRSEAGRAVGAAEDREWHRASLWTGGFPCQDLSVAGKRRGLAGARSGLAFAFLDLVERHRPPAVLLENVPGLLSSHAGRDFGTLVGRLGELGYVGAFRVLDARYFGVPQRRRRVFILAIHARVDPSGQRAAEVLSVGSRCGRHPATGVEAGPDAAAGARAGVDVCWPPLDTAPGHQKSSVRRSVTPRSSASD